MYDSPFDFLKAARNIDEVEYNSGKIEIDVNRVKDEFFNLINDKFSSYERNYCSLMYQTYKKEYKRKGRRFDKESFFLYWLADRVKASEINVTEKIVFKDESSGSAYQYFIEPGQKVKNLEKLISEFIKKEIPDSNINSNPKRIKSKLWRLRKSGILSEIKKSIFIKKRKLEKSQPDYFEKLQERKKDWKKMKFIYKVADFIRERPQGVSQRELLRRFSNKRESDLTKIMEILKYDCGIEVREEGRSTVYYCPRPGFFFVYYKAHKD